MPIIKKARIVNFKYNHNQILIPDETIDFIGNSEHPTPASCLNLRNGGGKTTLILAMIQACICTANYNIVPEIKETEEQKKKRYQIEDYFQSTDRASYPHSFIMLEWKKDESDEYITTGIAITGTSTKKEKGGNRGDSSQDDNKETSKTKVNYYHFFSEYSDDSDENPYSLSGMPLSYTKDNKFFSQNYEYVRELSKQSNGRLIYFNEEDEKLYNEKLEEYGISIGGIQLSAIMCSSENGISEYFSKMNARKLVEDYFLGKIIEVGLSKFYKNKSDKTLRDIVAAFIEKKNEKHSLYENKTTYERLFYDISKLTDDVNDKIFVPVKERNEAASKSVGLLKSIQFEINTFDEELNNIGKDIKNLEDQKIHVKYEEASCAYLDANENYDKTTENINKTKILIDAATTARNDLEKQRDLLECAKYYQTITKKQAQIDEFRNQISIKESNSNEAEHLNNLKYSVKEKLEPFRCEAETRLKKATEKENSCKKAKTDLINQKNEFTNEYNKQTNMLNRISGELYSLKKATDKIHDDLNIPGTRRMDDFYSSEEIEKEYANKEKTLDNIRASINDAKKEREDLETEQNRLQKECLEISARKTTNENLVESLDEKLKEHHAAEEQIYTLSRRYEKKTGDIYNGLFLSSLEEKLANVENRIGELKTDIRTKENDIRNIENNVFYYESRVIEAINDTGISYQTGENFISIMPKLTDADKENVHNLLDRHPDIVYSVIVDTPKDRLDLLAKFPKKIVTHSLTPIFTRSEIASILNDETSSDEKYIYAFNEQLLFQGKNEVLKQLKEAITACESELEKLQKEKIDLDFAIKTITDFVTKYEQNWAEITQNRKDLAIKVIESDQKREIEINETILKNKNRSKELSDKALKDTKQEHEVESWLNRYKDLKKNMEEELRINEKKNKTQEAATLTKRILEETIEKLAEVEVQLSELASEIGTNKDVLSKTLPIYDDVKDAKAGKLFEEDWTVLYQKYQTAREALEESISGIRKQIASLQEEVNQTSNDLATKSSEYEREEYINLEPSVDKEKECQIGAREKQKTIDTASALLGELRKEQAIYQTASESAYKSYQKLGFSEPLPKSEIGKNFLVRISEIDKTVNQKASAAKILEDKKRKYGDLERDISYILKDNDLQEAEPAAITLINPKEQWENLKDIIMSKTSTIRRQKDQLQITTNNLSNLYASVDGIKTFTSTLMNCIIINDIDATENHLLKAQDVVDKKYRACKSDLEYLEKDMEIVVDQALQQAEVIYNSFLKISAAAKLTLDGSKRPLLEIKVPKQVDKLAAKARIEGFIHQLADETIQKIHEKEPRSIKSFINREISENLNNAELLYKYINTSYIPVMLFKFDSCTETRKLFPFDSFKHSTGEGTASYSILLLVGLNYLSSPTGIISNRGTVPLILDNPFGSTSSTALTQPMFSLAKQLKVQMISVTGHNEHSISNLFDRNIVAKVAPMSAIGYRLLINDDNKYASTLESGAYSTNNRDIANKLINPEQLSLLLETPEIDDNVATP